MGLRIWMRRLCAGLGIDWTQNMRYDRQMRRLIRRHLSLRGVGVDVGAHRGEYLGLFYRLAPRSTHYALEPLPNFYAPLRRRWGHKAVIIRAAAAEQNGYAAFYEVLNDPAYSGLQPRDYPFDDPRIRLLRVVCTTLDEVIPIYEPVQVIKIDVEGGEMGVLRGSRELIRRCQPLVLLETGEAAARHYEVTPADLFSFVFGTLGYDLYTLKSFWLREAPLSYEAFLRHYESGDEYCFAAWPRSREQAGDSTPDGQEAGLGNGL